MFHNELEDVSEFDFMLLIANTFAGLVQYGHRIDMCETLVSTEFKADPITGLAKISLA